MEKVYRLVLCSVGVFVCLTSGAPAQSAQREGVLSRMKQQFVKKSAVHTTASVAVIPTPVATKKPVRTAERTRVTSPTVARVSTRSTTNTQAAAKVTTAAVAATSGPKNRVQPRDVDVDSSKPLAFRPDPGFGVKLDALPLKSSEARPLGIKIDTVMLHFSSDVVEHPGHPYDAAKQIEMFRKLGVSAHYLIDRDGTIYQMVPESRRAFHAGKGRLPFRPEATDNLNANSIGIEMLAVGSESDMRMFMPAQRYQDFATSHPELIGFTDAQYDALKELLDDILVRNPHIKFDAKHIVGHEDYAPTRRTDPGQLFDWKRIGIDRSKLQTQARSRDTSTSGSRSRKASAPLRDTDTTTSAGAEGTSNTKAPAFETSM